MKPQELLAFIRFCGLESMLVDFDAPMTARKAAATFPATSMPDRDWWSALWPDPEGVLRLLGIEPRMTVLDLCCGDGYFTAPLARLVGGKVHALDLDPEMIERAKLEVASQGASARQWIYADALDVAIPSIWC